MLLVLYGHALGVFPAYGDAVKPLVLAQLKIIYGFHMPIFFLLSGLVSRPRPWRQMARGALALLFTAYLVHAFCWACETLWMPGRPDWKGLLLPLVELRQFRSVIVWFLAALALVQAVYFVLAATRWPLRVGLGVLVVLAFAWAQSRASNVFELSALLPGLVFYAAGRALVRTDWRQRLQRLRLPLALAGAVIALSLPLLNGGCGTSPTAQCHNIPGGFIVVMVAGQYGFLPAFLIAAAAASLAVLWVSGRIAGGSPSATAGLSWVGRRSLPLLVINGLVIFFAHPLLLAWLGEAQRWSVLGVSVGLVVLQLGVVGLASGVVSLPLRLARWMAERVVPVR